MEAGQYTSFYVKRKSRLFPLIEKYANIKISEGVTHGQLIPLYHRLLTTDVLFRSEVDSMITEQPFKNIVSTTPEAIALRDKAAARNSGGGLFSKIIGVAGNIFGSIQADKQAKLESDKLFYETVLNEQKRDDTTKVLIVSGIALVFVGIAVFAVMKAKN
jgi:hypothetical protein